ncbi:DUF378 domain-containing protein [candidate division WOR-3 bacterium]|jgi:uncharacterized membrane protein YuzA (DUF378 family)|nr:DUF378 domain-containing protein [candidate division WOR-3 bacterium]
MKKLSIIDLIALILLIVGGLNWGLALFNINLVPLIFRVDILIKIVYALVGLSAIYILVIIGKLGKK